MDEGTLIMCGLKPESVIPAMEIVLKQLATRYGQLSAAVAARVQGANTADLDAIAQRVLTAQTLDEALGTR